VSKSNSVKKKTLGNIEIVLVSPQIPENIGLVSRVLKNTTIANLSLVNPNLTKKSFEVAKRARDVLDKARRFDNLSEAVANSAFVFGSTRRKREDKFIFNFNSLKHFVVSLASKKKVSIVFGREDFGLSKNDLALCDSIFYLPANSKFSSYNLAQCAGIVCFEIFNLLECLEEFPYLELAKRKEYQTLFDFLQNCLTKKIKKQRINQALASLKRLFLRTHLTKNEISLLKSLLK